MAKIAEKSGTLKILDMGICDYGLVLDKQLELCGLRQNDSITDTIILVEHPPVITLGARQDKNCLLADENELAKKDIAVVPIRRGGGSTAHNPGQMVFYPIIHLKQRQLGINEYIRKLEQIGIELFSRCGIAAERKKGLPGLWVGEKKIASIGVKVSRSVTYHGMAININNDLAIFDYIVPCGLDGVEMTSVLKETGCTTPMEKVKTDLSEILLEHFA